MQGRLGLRHGVRERDSVREIPDELNPHTDSQMRELFCHQRRSRPQRVSEGRICRIQDVRFHAPEASRRTQHRGSSSPRDLMEVQCSVLLCRSEAFQVGMSVVSMGRAQIRLGRHRSLHPGMHTTTCEVRELGAAYRLFGEASHCWGVRDLLVVNHSEWRWSVTCTRRGRGGAATRRRGCHVGT